MDDNTIEIRDDEINVKEIMKKIQENIRRKQAAGEIPPDPDSIVGSSVKNCPAESDEAIHRDLSFINVNWDIHNTIYSISSHHKFLGKFLVKGRQVINGEVRRYVDPVLFRQSEFNASTVRLLIEISQHNREVENSLTRLKLETDQKISCINSNKIEFELICESRFREFQRLIEHLKSKNELRFQELYSLAEELDSKNEMRFQEWFSQLDADIHSRASLARILEERIQKGFIHKGLVSEPVTDSTTNYFLFEERFRGSREIIKERQLSFLPYFERCSHVLDIGCGRGEFLEILRDHDIGASGIDLDPDMVAFCQSRQLEVCGSDAITYLEKMEDKSLDGIFIDQVVEHLEPEYLVRLLASCYRKLKFGCFMVVETVNPLSFVSFVNFYIDLTHKRPIHPETLQFLMCAAGFRESEKEFFSPISEEGRLKKITDSGDLAKIPLKNIEIYNENIDKLNSILFGAQDYVIIGKK